MTRVQSMCRIALLAAALAVTGAIRTPSFIPGAEFQLSAPFAVAICSVFGFKRYLIAGLIASAVQLILGTHTLLNVGVAMVFRVTAGAIVAWGANHPWAVAAAGPAGTAAARLCFSYVLHAPAWPLLLAAMPGMVYTALFAAPLASVISRIAGSTSKRTQALRTGK